MVNQASSSSPSSSPVTVMVSSSGKAGGIRAMSLTSPVRRASLSNNPNSPLSNRARRASTGGNRSSMSKEDATEEVNSEFVSYTVHIPPTPDRQTLSASQTSIPEDGNEVKLERSYISGTIFTGGFNSVTRGHVIECSMEKTGPLKSGSACGMRGCDEAGIQKGPCECGFKICRDCYLDCFGNGGGRCPGCKEPYKNHSDEEEDDDEDGPKSEAEDQVRPLSSMADFKLDKRLSVVKSFKQNHPGDFDHTRWLFETKGTYGYGNAVWPKEGYGVGSSVNGGFEHPPDFGERSRRPLTRKTPVSAAILSPYR